jgi:hypothetical protein
VLSWLMALPVRGLTEITQEISRNSLLHSMFSRVVNNEDDESDFRALKEAAYKQTRTTDRAVDGHRTGSSFAFHGSYLGNWVGILQNGLQIHSGTPEQTHGAALGPGLYTTDNPGLSLIYAKADGLPSCKKWAAAGSDIFLSRYGSDARCIAMVEIINSPEGNPDVTDQVKDFPAGPANVRVTADAKRVILRSLVVVEKDKRKLKHYEVVSQLYAITYDQNLADSVRDKLFTYWDEQLK